MAINDINKFRLFWRNSPRYQIESAVKSEQLLESVINVLGDVSTKLDGLASLGSKLDAVNLKLQAVSDNTSCTCNGINSVLEALKTIQDQLNALVSSGGGTPSDVFMFDFIDDTFLLTPDQLDAASFTAACSSLKNGAVYSDVVVESTDFPATLTIDASVLGTLTFSYPAADRYAVSAGMYRAVVLQNGSNIREIIHISVPAVISIANGDTITVAGTPPAAQPLYQGIRSNFAFSSINGSVTSGDGRVVFSTTADVNKRLQTIKANGLNNLSSNTYSTVATILGLINGVASPVVSFNLNITPALCPVTFDLSGATSLLGATLGGSALAIPPASVSVPYNSLLALPTDAVNVGKTLTRFHRLASAGVTDAYFAKGQEYFITNVNGVNFVAEFASLEQSIDVKVALRNSSQSFMNVTPLLDLYLLINSSQAANTITTLTFRELAPGELQGFSRIVSLEGIGAEFDIVGFQYDLGGFTVSSNSDIDLRMSGDGSTPQSVFNGSLASGTPCVFEFPVHVVTGDNPVMFDLSIDIYA